MCIDSIRKDNKTNVGSGAVDNMTEPRYDESQCTLLVQLSMAEEGRRVTVEFGALFRTYVEERKYRISSW